MISGLEAGLYALGIRASNKQVELWHNHLEMIVRWNRVYNLTAIDAPEQMLPIHLLDSLSIVPYIQGKAIMDIGSGAGLPGIPLAVYEPEWQLTLLDASSKKIRFLRQVVIELDLEHVKPVHERVEEYRNRERFDTIICRAYASLATFIDDTARLLRPNGKWLAMKGRYPVQELAALKDQFTYTVIPLTVPGLNAERHLITIKRN
jgi:16S rRNA (guanine527-N7)-methyltransferase